MRHWRLLLIIIALICFGVALSYPIRYRVAEESNNADMESLAAMRARVISEMNGEAPDNSPGANEPENQITENVNEADRTAREDREQSGLVDVGAAAPDNAAGTQSGADGISADAGITQEGAQGQLDVPASADSQASQPSNQGGATQVSDGGASQGPSGDASRQQQGGATQAPDGQANAAGDQATGQGGQASEETGDEGAPDDHGFLIPVTFTPGPTLTPSPEPTPTPTPRFEDMLLDYVPGDLNNSLLRATPSPTPVPTIAPTPTPDRSIRKDALPYPEKEKVTLDRSKILPELREIYQINQDLVGWLNIPDTVVDYPVVQCADREYYLDHDFYKQENINGQIILDTTCDAYTPSYNLIISGHHMKNGSMFGNLPLYTSKSYWEKHKIIHFDTLMSRNDYVIFAAFYSADYDEDEKGFRYSANIQYKLEADMWLEEVWENQLYDTGVEAKFGDEFITLTTCNRARHRNGRFVIVARKLREGEIIE